MVRLTRLKIDRFRNVKPGTDLRFGPTFNVLLGKNATGKTTLLDLVAAVTNDDLSAYAKEEAGFDLTWWLEKDKNQLEVQAVRAPARPGALSERARSERDFDDNRVMVLRIAGIEAGRLEVTGARGIRRIQGESDVPFDLRGSLATENAGRRVLFSAVAEGAASPLTGQVIRAMDDMLNPAPNEGLGRFDEAIVMLDLIMRSQFELSGDALRSTWLPRDFAFGVFNPKSPDPLVISFTNLGALTKIPAALGFASAELRPRMLARSQHADNVTTTYQGFDCLFQRADGSRISHELLSFGQKRLFSFLWYLAVREELPVVADELLNGLHHAWIEVCLDRLYERQSFLSTQHPYLLDHIPIESADGVRQSFIRCTLEAGPDGREQMAWRNFTEHEAERFFIAYQTGVQQVSEVLRTEGLW